MFFFEKKNQKTFATWCSLHQERPKPGGSKVFCCFFSKKQSFLLFCLAVPAAGANAHAIAGARVFPVTLTIDDPGVADEATVPQIMYQRSGAEGGPGPFQDIDAGFEYDKRITQDFGFAFNDDLLVQDTEHDKTRLGWGDLVITGKYQVYISPPHEFIVSLGVIRELGRTGTMHTGADDYGSTAPTLYFGKGLGDLPFDQLRPFAVTGEFSYTVADKELKAIAPPPPPLNVTPAAGMAAAVLTNNGDANSWSGGFSVQYSIPYLVSQIRDIAAPALFKHLVPLVEVAWSSPATRPSTQGTQITVAPGAIWISRAYQVGIEALIPANRATGTNVGAIVQFHLFLDDLLPRTLGAPVADW